MQLRNDTQKSGGEVQRLPCSSAAADEGWRASCAGVSSLGECGSHCRSVLPCGGCNRLAVRWQSADTGAEFSPLLLRPGAA